MIDQPGGYDGEVTVEVAGEPPRTAHAVFGARFEPLAGSVVWTGLLRCELPPGTELVVTTPHGSARARATERDLWGNTRVTGVDRPPFPVEVLDAPEPPGR